MFIVCCGLVFFCVDPWISPLVRKRKKKKTCLSCGICYGEDTVKGSFVSKVRLWKGPCPTYPGHHTMYLSGGFDFVYPEGKTGSLLDSSTLNIGGILEISTQEQNEPSILSMIPMPMLLGWSQHVWLDINRCGICLDEKFSVFLYTLIKS